MIYFYKYINLGGTAKIIFRPMKFIGLFLLVDNIMIKYKY